MDVDITGDEKIGALYMLLLFGRMAYIGKSRVHLILFYGIVFPP